MGAEQAGRWLRVSTTGQSEDNQVPDIDAHIADKGYDPQATYELHGKSASKGEQESALQQVIADITRGKISVLVVWCLDRLDRRGIAESFGTKLRIEAAGGRVEFVLEPSMDELTFAVKAWMAQQESKRRAERVNVGLDVARANGAATTNPPWGYRTTGPKRGKMFVPAAEGRRYVPGIYQRVADGESLTNVARTTGGKKWSVVTIASLIRNPTYRGTVLDREGNIAHRCEAIVDSGLWQRANDAINTPDKKRRGPAKPKAMLASVLRCGECGAQCYRTSPSKGRTTRYYRCRASHGLAVATWRVEAAVNRVMSTILADMEVMTNQLIPGTNWDAEVEQAKFELRHLDFDADDYDSRHAELRAELADLKTKESVPDRWESVGTGVTYAEVWAATDDAYRGAWLKKQGFQVRLWRDRVRVENGDSGATVPIA